MYKILGFSLLSFFTYFLNKSVVVNAIDEAAGIGYLISNFDEFLGTEEYCDDYLQSAENLVEDLEDELEDLEEDEERERNHLHTKLEEAENARDFIAIFGGCSNNGGCRRGFMQMVSRFGCTIKEIPFNTTCASIFEIGKDDFKSWVYVISKKETIQVKYNYKTQRAEGKATMGSMGTPVHSIHNNIETKDNSIQITSFTCRGSDFLMGKDDCWNN